MSFLFSFGPKNFVKLVKFIGVLFTSKVYRCLLSLFLFWSQKKKTVSVSIKVKGFGFGLFIVCYSLTCSGSYRRLCGHPKLKCNNVCDVVCYFYTTLVLYVSI